MVLISAGMVGYQGREGWVCELEEEAGVVRGMGCGESAAVGGV